MTSKQRDWIKVYTQNIHISANTAQQTCTPLTNYFWKYPVIKIFPVTVLNFRVCGILLTRGVIKINNKSCTVYKSWNYYNRLIIDMLIGKNSGLVCLRHSVCVQFHNTYAISPKWKFVEHVFRKTGFIIVQECVRDL